jgi:hypothetical protein
MKIKPRNLKRMANYVKNIPQEVFGMRSWRKGENIDPECSSIGCVVGHCTILDKSKFGLPRYINNEINFQVWSERFTGLSYELEEWDWCFNSDWAHVDNTPLGAAKRIEWFLENGLPENWRLQMNGSIDLCYK